MRRIALMFAAAGALAAGAPVAAAITVATYTASGPGNGTFTLEYDSSADAFTLTAMNFTIGSTTFTTSTAGIQSGSVSPPEPTVVGGDPSSINVVSVFPGVDDFSFQLDPTILSSQSAVISYYIAGANSISVGNETITGEIIRGSGFTPDVPEPATWAMMLLGFGAISAAMRRRNMSRLRLA